MQKRRDCVQKKRDFIQKKRDRAQKKPDGGRKMCDMSKILVPAIGAVIHMTIVAPWSLSDILAHC